MIRTGPARTPPFRTDALCTGTVKTDGALVVPDLACDARVAGHPALPGGLRLRSHAGVPIRVRSDTEGRAWPIGGLV